ncbi:MAG: DNA primase [Legionellales bacterium]|jgi:DNA primase|nr:DNA primase [Legionellales bacterium]
MASKIPKEFIDEVLSKSSIVDILSNFIKLKPFGHNYKSTCPFHNEKTPSFSVNTNNQFYHCFGCGASGNAITFLMAYNSLEFRDAVAYLANEVGLRIPELDNDDSIDKDRFINAYDLYDVIKKLYVSEVENNNLALNYIKERGITPEVASIFEIGFSTTDWDKITNKYKDRHDFLLELGLIAKGRGNKLYDRFRGRIMFPILNEKGSCIGFGARTISDEMPKYLNSSDSFVFKKGNELYGLYQALQQKKKPDNIIVVEGYMDVIALANHNVRNAVASLGTAITKNQLQKILRYSNKITFCFDGDLPGKKAAWKALLNVITFMHKGIYVKFVFLPEGEDPDSFIGKYGKLKLAEYFKTAKNLTDYFFEHMQSSHEGDDITTKANLINSCQEIISTIPKSTFRSLIEDRLNKIAGLNIVKKGLHKTQEQPLFKKANQASVCNKVLAMIIQQPILIKELDDAELDLSPLLKNNGLLLDVYNFIKDMECKLSTAHIIERYRDSDSNNLVCSLASTEILIPYESHFAECKALLIRERSQIAQSSINELLRKSKITKLNDEERSKLRGLIDFQKKS